MARTWTWPSAGMILLGACAPAAPSRGEVSEDGVAHVRHRAARAPATWSLEPSPALEIASDSTLDTSFHLVLHALRLDDGHLVVSNHLGGREVLIYAADGKFERRLGRRGQGPGEYEFPMHVFRSADTIFVVDGAGRIEAFLADGALVRSIPPPVTTGLGRPSRIGLLPGGAAVFFSLEPETADSFRHVSVFAQRGGEEIGELVRVPWRRAEDIVADPRRRPTFAPTGRFAVGGDRICAGLPDRYLIRCFDPSGAEVLRVERVVRPRDFTSAERERPLQLELAANTRYPATQPPPDVRQRIEEEHQRRVFAPHAPPFGQLWLSAAGELWVSDFDASLDDMPAIVAPEGPVLWNVFGRDGSWLADITLPAGFIPRDFGHDYVLGVHVDEDETERVQLWRFRR